jgi:hypothetical protein
MPPGQNSSPRSWEESLDEMVSFVRSRLRGDYSVDEFGFDPEFTAKIYLPLLRRWPTLGSGWRFGERRTFLPMALRCWSPITPALCRSTG